MGPVNREELGVSQLTFEAIEIPAHGAIPNIATELDTKASDQLGSDLELGAQTLAIFGAKIAKQSVSGRLVDRCRTFYNRMHLLNLETDQTLIGLEDVN